MNDPNATCPNCGQEGYFAKHVTGFECVNCGNWVVLNVHEPAVEEVPIMHEVRQVLKGCAIALVALAVVVALWKMFV